MDYKINDFEGPLDLLLHLIKKEEIAIKDIKVEIITNQYLSYIRQMKEANLDVASEYLVMAAELLEIKSRLYLPKEVGYEDLEDEYNPKEELIKKLEDYEKYKDMTTEFRKLEETRKYVFTNLSTIAQYKTPEENPKYDIKTLLKVFEEFEVRNAFKQPLATKVTKKQYSLQKRIKEIKSKLSRDKKIELRELVSTNEQDLLVVTFLAVLEMLKTGNVIITQKNNFDPIYLLLKGGKTDE